MPNYVSVHQMRNLYKDGGVSVCIHKNFEFKSKNDLSINCTDIASVSMEPLQEKRRNTLFNVVSRPPNDKIEPFEKFLKNLSNKSKNANKNYPFAGYFNFNL